MAEIPSPDVTQSRDMESTRPLAEERRTAQAIDVDCVHPRTWGDFQLLQRLGRGGFGEVFRAWDPMLEREVALKLLLPRGQDEEQQFATLITEARAIARVRHSNIVSVYGVDRREGRVGFWSDYVRGQTLAAWIAACGPLNEEEAAKVGMQLCNALAAVHNAGLLHRDIKPGNAMRDQDGRVLLMDFGLTQELLATASLAGTPGYLAPELRDGQQASAQSDIYAMGVLLRFLLSGSPVPLVPAPGKQKTPSRLQLIIAKATEMDPKARFASADQMAKALGEIVAAPAQRPQTVWSKWLSLPWLVVLLLALGFVFGPRLFRKVDSGVGPAAGTPAYADYLAANEALGRYDKPGNTDKAISLYQAALKNSPNYALAEAGLARAYWRKFSDTSESKWADQATEAAGRAAQMNPNLAAVQMTLGSIHVDQGKFEVGVDELQKAENLDHRSSDVHAALAEAYRQQGRLDDAKNEFQTAMDLDPDNWRWPYLLGALQIDSGDLTGAEKNLKAALAKSQDNARILYDLGIVYRKQDRLAEAQNVLEGSVELDPRPNPVTELGNVLFQKGDYAGAIQRFQQAIKISESKYGAWGNLGTAYLASGEGTRADEAFRKAIALGLAQAAKTPEDSFVVSVLGYYYANIHDRDHALPLMRKAVALAPGDPDVLERVGEAYEQLGDRQQALAFLEKALKQGYSASYARSDPALKALRRDPNAPSAIRESNSSR
ncbi:serine/threonine-protein kinase [Occallatibacter riparius]|uniref:Tetratricopeptide repeat protein n=1 Tax=Occallatibacter riparius TaxID=1002689 RepID=A0A9J7BLT1_9BACT|nr:serine/threonine-protein kinase [Occallatibacter riparius]UWZ82173.1 tetratricopeptide repeat protein [Occallatibacter riparius]